MPNTWQGWFPVVAIARTLDGRTWASDVTNVWVQMAAPPEAITFGLTNASFFTCDQPTKVGVRARYADGIWRNLSGSAFGTSYSSSRTSIAAGGQWRLGGWGAGLLLAGAAASPGGSGACRALTNAGPVFTVTVNPAPQTNQGCLGPFLMTPGGLASNAMTLCISNTPAMPGVTNPVYAGTNWTAYTTCNKPAWQTNFTAVNWSVNTFWLPPPARLDVVGAHGYTCYAVVSPPAGSPCAAVTNVLGAFTVNVVETLTTNFACAWSGGLATNAGPAWTNQTVCAGASVAPPGFNGGYTNGAVRLQVFNCNNTLKLDTNLPVAYGLSGPAFEPCWPGNFPAGSTSVVMVVVGVPDNTNCAPLTNRFTITVTGTPGPVKLTLTGYNDTTKVTPGALLALNDDDDNTNNVPDWNDGTLAVTNENDLLEVNFSAPGLASSNRITLSAAGSGTGRLKA